MYNNNYCACNKQPTLINMVFGNLKSNIGWEFASLASACYMRSSLFFSRIFYEIPFQRTLSEYDFIYLYRIRRGSGASVEHQGIFVILYLEASIGRHNMRRLSLSRQMHCLLTSGYVLTIYILIAARLPRSSRYLATKAHRAVHFHSAE